MDFAHEDSEEGRNERLMWLAFLITLIELEPSLTNP